MSTVRPLPPAGTTAEAASTPAAAIETADNEALIAVTPQEEEQDEALSLSAPVSRLPVELDVAVPVEGFRVRNLLALEAGQVIETQWANGEDVPLATGELQLAWSEFEVMDTQLAVRVTRLA
jgi:flagellar motor switch protein FliM